MSATTIPDVVNAFFNGLQNHATLSYIAKWYNGNIDGPRPMFPFIGIGEVRKRVEPETTGRQGNDRHEYDFTIIAGQRNLAGIAYNNVDAGNDKTKNGILQIAEDIETVVRVNDFTQTFRGSVDIDAIEITPGPGDAGNVVWLAIFKILGDVVVQRNA